MVVQFSNKDWKHKSLGTSATLVLVKSINVASEPETLNLPVELNESVLFSPEKPFGLYPAMYNLSPLFSSVANFGDMLRSVSRIPQSSKFVEYRIKIGFISHPA